LVALTCRSLFCQPLPYINHLLQHYKTAPAGFSFRGKNCANTMRIHCSYCRRRGLYTTPCRGLCALPLAFLRLAPVSRSDTSPCGQHKPFSIFACSSCWRLLGGTCNDRRGVRLPGPPLPACAGAALLLHPASSPSTAPLPTHPATPRTRPVHTCAATICTAPPTHPAHAPHTAGTTCLQRRPGCATMQTAGFCLCRQWSGSAAGQCRIFLPWFLLLPTAPHCPTRVHERLRYLRGMATPARPS